MSKSALITGITGQDGSYLAELLLEKGYRVCGLIRRLSTPNLSRIENVVDKIELIEGDLTDQSSINNALKESMPDEVYNLAAQSFVATSWNQPVLTGDVTGLGAVRILEGVRHICPDARFYQASSSEMFGKVHESPQNENTRFYPRSPYGVAKLYAYWACVNYRESYGMHASNGILFNHESLTNKVPIIIQDRYQMLDILPIEDVFYSAGHRPEPILPFKIWDNGRFSDVIGGNVYWHDISYDDKGVHSVDSRGGYFEATKDHVVIMDDGKEKKCGDLVKGDRIKKTDYPPLQDTTFITNEFAWLLGAFVGDGHCGYHEGVIKGRFTNQDTELVDKFADLWIKTTNGGVSDYKTISTWSVGGKETIQLDLLGAKGILDWMDTQCYTRSRWKKIPKIILNSNKETIKHFLDGFNEADGTFYKYNNRQGYVRFNNKSPSVIAGLLWLSKNVLQECNPTLQTQRKNNETYFSLNLNTPDSNSSYDIIKNDIRKIEYIPYKGWLYDLTTCSGTFSAGIGSFLIHNSPRRGIEFVTRKITDGVARIYHGLASELRLGNLDAKRDWGYAGDYVKAMWIMMQQKEPDDYVVATGETHSVGEFAELAFSEAGLDWQKYVVVDPKFLRPAEIYALLGDASKAKRVLGWKPEVTFEELVKMMVEADVRRYEEKRVMHAVAR